MKSNMNPKLLGNFLGDKMALKVQFPFTCLILSFLLSLPLMYFEKKKQGIITTILKIILKTQTDLFFFSVFIHYLKFSVQNCLITFTFYDAQVPL